MLFSVFSNETNRAHRWSLTDLLWTGRSRWDRILSMVLILAVLGAMGIMVYMIVTPQIEERFTEFYILGPEGDADNYPGKLTLEEEGRVNLGITNQEHEETAYRVEVTADNKKINEIGPIVLNHEEKWEQEVAFIFTRTGLKQKVEFLLYKEGQAEAYRSLHLWVDVTR